MIKREEMKLIDLGKLISEMEVGDTIDFANCEIIDVERIGGWYGVKRIDEFDNDNLMYLVSYWGGEANVKLYHNSEYDPRIGDFCEENLDDALCCAKMIADYLIDYEGHVNEVITVEGEMP